jgi:hypothetical protein
MRKPNLNQTGVPFALQTGKRLVHCAGRDGFVYGI